VREDMMRVLFLVVAVASGLAWPAGPVRSDGVDDYLKAAIARDHIPGLAIAVIRDGKLLFERQCGSANLETNTPVTRDSVFRFQSISKQFATAATLRLVEQGQVGLEDDVSKYLDKLPPAWKTITVRHLLSATSGIPDYRNDVPAHEGLAKKPLPELLQALGAKPLRFSPGEDWSYCNTGFWMLAAVVAKRTGKPYQEYLRDQFLSPLGMTATRKGSYRSVVRNRVSGYGWASGEWHNVADEDRLNEGDGELIGTLGDLVKWDTAVTDGKVVKPETLRLMQTEAKLNRGRVEVKLANPRVPSKSSYGLGSFLADYRGHRVVWTPGAGSGFSTSLTRFPDDQVTVIVLCNLNSFLLADALARGVAEYVIPGLKANKGN
jgi:CubicO group peptidase (beta-lactamase class C family)